MTLAIETDIWTIKTSRIRTSTKARIDLITSTLNLTQDESINMAYDALLEKIAEGYKIKDKKEYPFMANVVKILKQNRGNIYVKEI